MAQAAHVAARFMTEVAPPQVVSVMQQRRKKVPRSLDTIVEDDREQQLACGLPSDHGFAAAWSLPTPPQPWERAGGFVARGLVGKYLSDAHDGCQASGWEGGHMLGHRRAVHAQELHEVGA